MGSRREQVRIGAGIAAGILAAVLGVVAGRWIERLRPPPAAWVDGHPIPRVLVDRAVASQVEREGSPVSPTRAEALRAAALHDLVNQVLLYDEAVASGIHASAGDVAKELARMAQGQDPRALVDKLEKRGMTEADLVRDLEVKITIERLLARALDGVRVDPEGVERRWKEHRGDYDLPERVRTRALVAKGSEEAIRARRALSRGAEFQRVVADLRDRGAGGGQDLGFVGPGQLPREIEKSLRAVPPGHWSAPVSTPQGWIVLGAGEHLPARHPALSEVRRQVETDELHALQMERVHGLLAQLRKRARITTLEPEGSTEGL